MMGLFDTEFLSSSHVAPSPTECLAVCTAVAKLSKKGREIPRVVATHSADLDFAPHGLGFLLGFDEDVATRRASLGFFE